MHYQEHTFLIFNTSAFFFRTGLESYTYFFLDNLPALLGGPFLIAAYVSYYKRLKAERVQNRLNRIKID